MSQKMDEFFQKVEGKDEVAKADFGEDDPIMDSL
jgi:hypothetical protein